MSGQQSFMSCFASILLLLYLKKSRMERILYFERFDPYSIHQLFVNLSFLHEFQFFFFSSVAPGFRKVGVAPTGWLCMCYSCRCSKLSVGSL
jgi:hypothetical protein